MQICKIMYLENGVGNIDRKHDKDANIRDGK